MQNQNEKFQFINIKLIFFIVLILITIAFYLAKFNEGSKPHETDPVVINQNSDDSNSEMGSDEIESQVLKTYSSKVYGDEAIMIDKEFNARFENQFPVVPLFKLESEFQSKAEVDEYLNDIFNDINSNTLESLELANMCSNKYQSISIAQQNGNQKLLDFYDVLFDKCSLVTGENDIFFIVEKMAIQGDTFEQINYLNNLNNAISRGVIKPLVDPYGYIEKRELAIGWLQQLASKGVVRAYENLALLYRSEHNHERDNVLAYYYASLAHKHALITDYNEYYLDNLKSELTEKELERLSRIMKF
jgi:hypothetical protein